MFKYTEDLKFTTMTPKSITSNTVPASWNGLKFAPAPRFPDQTKPGSEGAVLVMQYVEGYLYRTYGMYRMADSKIDELLEKARKMESETEDQPDEDDYPQLQTLLEACQYVGCVCNGVGNMGKIGAQVGFVKNDINHLKYYIRQYGQLIIETKITSTTYNQYDYTIDSVGENLDFDEYSKGFIAYGYDSDWIYMQNTLGPFAGSLGFHRMKWNAALQLIKRGACWWLKNPS